MDYIYVEKQEQFESYLKNIKLASYIGVDTESDSLYSYYEKLCLIQICADRQIYLIDTLSVNIKALSDVFANNSIRKIFHSAESDIPLIKTLIDCDFNNIFDVMLAAKYGGIYRCGLNNLIEKYFSVSLNKKYQKANWGIRPLKKEMLEYAAMDVLYLKKLKDILIPMLKSKNLLEEFLAHSSSLGKLPKKTYFFDPYGYLRINGAKKLKRENLEILGELYLRREEVARKSNVPPFKIISNETMFKIASDYQTACDNLKSFKGITDYVFNRHSQWILEAIKKGLEKDNKVIQIEKRKTLNIADLEKYRIKFEVLRKWRMETAKKRDLFPELIFTNDILWHIAHMKNLSMEEFVKIGIDEYKIKLYAEELITLLSKINEK